MAKKKAPPAPNRRDRARATRLRIAQAAYRVFCARGFLQTTMEAIATEAGVAVQTVYFTFHTKIEVLFAAFDAAVLGDSGTPPDQRAWFAALLAETDAKRAISLLVDNAGEIFRRVAPLAAVFSTLGSIPEATERFEQRENLRKDSFSRIAKVLADKAPLRAGLQPGKAGDVLFVLLSPAVYHALTAGSGWSHAEWARWAREMVALELHGKV